MNSEEIQRLAEELPLLERPKDSARITAVENAIVSYELGLLKNIGGKAYFPLLKKSNGVIPYEYFYDIFIDVLMSLIKGYKPEKGSFATALAFILNRRVNDYFAKLAEITKIETSLEERLEKRGESGEPTDGYDFTENAAEELHTEIRAFARLAPLIAETMKMDAHTAIKMRFERFFTFDVTKTVKGDMDCARESVMANGVIFPIMEVTLLEYLMFGSFSGMSDVVENGLKDAKMLDKRNETIQKCYNISKPTVCARNAEYYKVFKQALARWV